jgi:hypothetical protein
MPNLEDDWTTTEWFAPHTTAEQPARLKARAAPGKLPPAQAAAVADINARYKSDLNDDLPDL